MLAVRTPAVDLSATLVRAFLPALRGARTLLQSLALALLLLCVSGTSWAQLGTSTTSVIKAPPGTNYLPPPPDDPEPPAPYDGATGVSISAPSTMAPGSTAYVTVTIRNSGTTTWYSGLSYPYRLGSQNPQDNTTWGMGRVDLGSTVAPGGQAVFGFTITAPTTPGSYTFGWAMLREGMHWFGGNISSTITVAAPAPVYDAQLVSASVPTTMTPGGGYNVSMMFRNSGNTTWTSPDFLLATPDDNVAFGMNRIAMSPSTVAPGQNATFNFQVSAPSSAGTYTFQWGMVWEFHQRFGQYSTTSITVGGTNGAVTYIHTDGLGSPVARTDSAGNVISRTRYEPYGYVASGVQPTIGFSGHVNDVDTELTYMQQRYYDPVAGRFLSIDPVTTDSNTGGSFNRYAYANNSPYQYIDPDGRFAFLIPFVPYVATATVAVVGHYVLPGRQGREETARAVAKAILNQGNSQGSSNASGGGKSTPLPDKLVGVQDDKSGTQGNRVNNGPLAPEHGGTNDAGKDFDHLTGGKSGPAPEGSKYPAGTQVGDNGVALRPGGKTGPRIDIPANGEKPHETLHYPKKDP